MALERTFDVAVDCDRFQAYIHELRGQLRDPRREAPFPNRHPDLYLLRQTIRGAPSQWLHLTMVAGNAQVIVWIRTDNLYVIGFEHQVQGARRRHELGINPDNDPKQKNKKKKDKEKNAKKKKKEEDEVEVQVEPLIPGATFLGFRGNYDSLGVLLSGPVEGTRTRPNLGRQQLVDAIRGLAAYTPPRDREMVREHQNWVRTIVITISESLRLHEVCQFIDRLLQERRSGWLNTRLIDCIHGWDLISACVVASATDPDGDDHGRYNHLKEICKNKDEACKVVAILNTGSAADHEQPGPSNRRPRREAPHLLGLTFVEIFSAVVRRHGSSSSNNRNLMLYGHIAITDGLSSGGSSQLLFTRGRRSNALLLTSADDGRVVLTGPARAVWGYGEIVMRVDLMDAIPGFVADMTPDDEVGSGKLVWDTYDTPRMVYDEVEEYVFEGVSGSSINVRCAVITNAVVANVALSRTGRRGTGQTVDVYGILSAATAKFSRHDKVTLFDRVWKDAVSVGAGEDVPLLRKVVIVPFCSLLRIRAILLTRSQVADMSADEQISSGVVAEFQPMPFGVVSEVIGHGDVKLKVTVTWSLN